MFAPIAAVSRQATARVSPSAFADLSDGVSQPRPRGDMLDLFSDIR
jgi:hypothetical protein